MAKGKAEALVYGDITSSLKVKFLNSYTESGRGCWPWSAYRNEHGYGRLTMSRQGKSKSYLASRIAYVLFQGDISTGEVVCHTCDNPACVNPKHLFLASQKDNIADCVRKKRNARGSTNGNSKLTRTQVDYARAKAALGFPRGIIEKELRVAKTTLQKILVRDTWFHEDKGEDMKIENKGEVRCR